jgi:hypothetical protein
MFVDKSMIVLTAVTWAWRLAIDGSMPRTIA